MMRIGSLELSNNLLLAPMAGYTDLAFRLLVKRHGAGMVFTEMVSARGLVVSNRNTEDYLTTTPEEFPLSAQIFGSDPIYMAEAAVMIQERGIAALDVNMGCPVRKVVKNGAGAALMKDVSLAQKIITSIRKAVSLPLTVKLRSGWDSESINCHHLAQVAEDCGADGIIIHPRTARQLFSGQAEWKIIREIKEKVSIPVIGNGDIRTFRDVAEMEAMTGCDGVMIGRGTLGNPWIFQEANEYTQSGSVNSFPTFHTKLTTMLNHLDLIRDRFEERAGVNRFKAHIAHYLKGMPGVKVLRHTIYSEVKTYDDLQWSIYRLFNTFSGDSAGSGYNERTMGDNEQRKVHSE